MIHLLKTWVLGVFEKRGGPDTRVPSWRVNEGLGKEVALVSTLSFIEPLGGINTKLEEWDSAFGHAVILSVFFFKGEEALC